MRLSLIQDKPIIWAHRGGRALAPENTLRALVEGHEAGADGWETDVVLSKDGVPVLLHDLNLLRTTNASVHPDFAGHGPALPWRFTLEELKKLSAGIFPRRKCGCKWSFPEAEKVPENERIPTLEEALSLSRKLDMWVNIEIKDVSKAMPRALEQQIVSKTLEVVEQLDMADQVIVSSFNHEYVAEVKRIAPKVLTGALTPHNFEGDPVTAVKAAGADAWHPGFRQLTKEAVEAVRVAGIAVNPYTVNDIETLNRLVEWGVTGIVTDCPQLNAGVNCPKQSDCA